MSFIGSVNAETRKWLGNNGPAFDGRQVSVIKRDLFRPDKPLVTGDGWTIAAGGCSFARTPTIAKPGATPAEHGDER